MRQGPVHKSTVYDTEDIGVQLINASIRPMLITSTHSFQVELNSQSIIEPGGYCFAYTGNGERVTIEEMKQ